MVWKPGAISRPLRLVVPLAMIAAPVVLVLLQPNLGTATLLALCGALLLFLAGSLLVLDCTHGGGGGHRHSDGVGNLRCTIIRRRA